MKLSKALLGAILVGLTAQTTGCVKKDSPAPKEEKGGEKGKNGPAAPDYCLACGMG